MCFAKLNSQDLTIEIAKTVLQELIALRKPRAITPEVILMQQQKNLVFQKKILLVKEGIDHW